MRINVNRLIPHFLLVGCLALSAGCATTKPLIEAAKAGDTAVVQALLDAGADVNTQDEIGMTALMWAAANGHTAAIQVLLKAGADVNAKVGALGQTALMMAAGFGRTAAVQALLVAGANVNAKNEHGQTALIVAAGFGHPAAVQTLLEAGADAEAKNKDGWTALMAAASQGHSEVVQLLNEAEAREFSPGPIEPRYIEQMYVYTNSTYHWSISYPSNWIVDDKNPAFVRILSSADNALCGIHSGPVRFKAVDEFTDFMLAQTEQSLKQRGLASVIMSRHRISLPNEYIGNDVLLELVPGGKSRRVFILADGQGYVIDCETYAKNWEKLEPFYERIISSFTLQE